MSAEPSNEEGKDHLSDHVPARCSPLREEVKEAKESRLRFRRRVIPVLRGIARSHFHASNGSGHGERTEKSKIADKIKASAPSSRWRGFLIRSLSTIFMISLFAFIVYCNHVYVCLLVIFIQIISFKEIVSLGYKKNAERRLPLFRTINWYFLLVTLYYVYGKGLFNHLDPKIIPSHILRALVRYHFFNSFILYTTGFVAFVCSLKEGMYKYQFSQYAWTHITLMLVVGQSNFMINNIYEGLIWFLLPCSLIIVNDITAYIFGFFFGRTPLIHLSPKKTWEGFIGGAFCTLAYGFLISRWMANFSWLVCPKTDFTTNIVTCQTDRIFIPRPYHLPSALADPLISTFGPGFGSFEIAPIQFHALSLAAFASIIAPFGGFFASGFKRAFKIKDFGDSIPGHGGMVDRMDCQYLMGLFAYVYHFTFVRSTDRDMLTVFNRVMRLSLPDQLALFEKLQQYLLRKGMLTGQPVLRVAD